MLDRILEQKALDTSVSIADWLPVLPTPTPRLPTWTAIIFVESENAPKV